MLFDELRAIRRDYGYLPPARLNELAVRREVPLHRINEVATFYPLFHLEPHPKVQVGVCCDLACHMRGSDQITALLKHRFPASSPGVDVRGISCPGQCDVAPAISINDTILGGVDKTQSENLIALALSDMPLPHPPRKTPAAGR